MRTLSFNDIVFLLLAMKWTLALSAAAFVFGGIVGIGIALARVSPRRWLAWPAIGYIRVVQGTPLLLQLFIVFFGADMLGVGLGAFLSAVLGLSLNAVGFLVNLVKSTSLTAIIGFVELTRAGQMLNNATFRPFTIFGIVAALYFLLCWPLTIVSRRLERRLASAYKR
jgi:polar amino acid transport system permease protein